MSSISSKFKAQSSKSGAVSDEPDAARAASDFELKSSSFELVVEDLRKSFRQRGAEGELEVLRGVSFSLGAGEALGVTGASGAGKTTLLHIVGGLEAADGGSVRLGEFDVMGAGAEDLARRRGLEVGLVFQFHYLLPDLTAEENVALPLMVARRGRHPALDAAREMLDAVGLRERAGHLAGELSGGEQQRVAVARALVTRPRLVLADEPTGNLDERTAREVGRLLLSLCRARGACIVVATHNEALARDCDRRLVLRNGQLAEKDEG